MKCLRAFNEGVAKVEGWLLVFLVLSMIVLSFAQVILRNFFDWGITWGDVGLRNMVLWVGFIGASLATKGDRHISIDALTRFLSPTWKAAADVLTSLVSLVLGGIFIWASVSFVISEYESHSVAFLKVQFWMLQIIIPIGFSLISMRFLIKVIEDMDYLIKHMKGEA